MRTNVDAPVTVHVSLSTDLSPGHYAMYARQLQWVQVAGGWTADDDGGILGTLAVTAAATATP